jgi:hypothetical protein
MLFYKLGRCRPLQARVETYSAEGFLLPVFSLNVRALRPDVELEGARLLGLESHHVISFGLPLGPLSFRCRLLQRDDR